MVDEGWRECEILDSLDDVAMTFFLLVFWYKCRMYNQYRVHLPVCRECYELLSFVNRFIRLELTTRTPPARRPPGPHSLALARSHQAKPASLFRRTDRTGSRWGVARPGRGVKRPREESNARNLSPSCRVLIFAITSLTSGHRTSTTFHHEDSCPP